MNVTLWSAVALVGGLGSVTRFMVDRAIARRAGSSFPLGTLTVNLSGAVALGFLSGLALRHEIALLAGTAFVGAYTTFSTWMFETQRLAEERQYRPAAANIVVSVAFGVAAAWLGHQIASGP